MRLLLDAHVLLWWLADEPTLGRDARKAIADARNSVVVSAATAWEIAIKRALGKLDAPDDLTGAIAANNFDELRITFEHAETAGALPPHHTDPFDRMLVAQATLEEMTIVTRDPRIDAYGVTVLVA